MPTLNIICWFVGLLFQLMDDALKTLSFIRHRQFDADTFMSTSTNSKLIYTHAQISFPKVTFFKKKVPKITSESNLHFI